ncbi:MAG: YdeI/OmpD-associated family protein [Jatrophihabitantaceae bacterium]
MVESEGVLHLQALLEPRGPAGAIVLTDHQVATLGSAKTPPVRVTANGVTAAARVGRMGGENLLGFSRKLRAELGVEIGQHIDVVITLDSQPRTVELPPALADRLGGDPEAKMAFEALAPSHQKEFARWVGEAKREQTLLSRVEQTLQMLREGRTRR